MAPGALTFNSINDYITVATAAPAAKNFAFSGLMSEEQVSCTNSDAVLVVCQSRGVPVCFWFRVHAL